MISRKKSINKPSEFYKLKKDGISIKSNNFQLKYVKSDEFKVAFIVSKLVSPVSPKRNKLKRIYKSLTKESGFDKNVLLAVYPKVSSLDKKFSELRVEFTNALGQIKY